MIRVSVYFVLVFCLFSVSPSVEAQTPENNVNIFFEGNTLTPVFYQGRAEPTTGSTARAVAVVSGNSAPDELTYRWTVGGAVVSTGQVGLTTIEIPLTYGEEQIVTVEVRDRLNRVLARNSELLELSEPLVHFYKDNPLRGVSRLAIDNGYIMTGDESTFRAEAYFMNRDVMNNQPRLEWEIDGQAIQSANDDPLTMTVLRTTPGQGQATVGFYLHNTRSIIQYVQNEFVVNY